MLVHFEISILQKETEIFPPTTGGAEVMCQQMQVPFLGKLPLDPRIGELRDQYNVLFLVVFTPWILMAVTLLPHLLFLYCSLLSYQNFSLLFLLVLII